MGGPGVGSLAQSAARAAQAQQVNSSAYPRMPKLCRSCIVLGYRPCSCSASSYSAPIPSPESSSGISGFMPTWIRQARARSLQLPGRILRPREVPGSLICNPLAHGPDFAEHGQEALLVHSLEELQGLEAVAHGWRCRRAGPWPCTPARRRAGLRPPVAAADRPRRCALRDRGADPWLISCLHQVRCFGNWMGHPPRGGRGRSEELHDLLAVLSSLQRVLQDYPW